MIKLLYKAHTYGSDVSHFHTRNFIKVVDAITYLQGEYGLSLVEIDKPLESPSKILDLSNNAITNAYKIDGYNIYVVEPTYPKLIRNAIHCLACDTVLESKHRHDFVVCLCSNQSFVDGGLSYSRRGGNDLNLVKDLCEYE